MSSWCWKPSQTPGLIIPTICLWCLSKLAWPIPGHTHWPLTLAQPEFCMKTFFFFLVWKWGVGEGGQANQCEILPALISFKRLCFFSFFFLFFKKMQKYCFKACGIIFVLISNLLVFILLSFYLSVKLTWKLYTGIGTQLCYLVPLAICWLLKQIL